jgi:flagellar hook-associated protein 2
MPLINFSGIASGIDTGALIEAILDADRKVKITPLEKKVTEKTEESSKLKELKTKLSELKDLGNNFRSINGGALSKSATSSDETVLLATADNDAFNTSVSMSVTTVASNSTASFNNTFASTDAIINPSATASTVSFTIGVGGTPETVNVSVSNTTTVSDFVTSFNTASSRAVATAVNVGTSASPSYKIVISTLEEGILKGDIATITDSSSFFTSGNTITHATNAVFSVSGIAGTITRYSNTIDDVIPGVTLNLIEAGTSKISVNDDTETSTETVQEFIDKYNEFIVFLAENNLVAPPDDDPNGLNEFGPLAKTRIDDNSLQALKTAISTSGYSGGSEVKILADLGITTNRDGTLNFNSSTFASAIAKESDSTKEILSDFGDMIGALESGGGLIDSFTKFAGVIDNATDSNSDSIKRFNERISYYEAMLKDKEASLLTQFSKLESLMGELQSKQAALTSAIASLGN